MSQTCIENQPPVLLGRLHVHGASMTLKPVLGGASTASHMKLISSMSLPTCPTDTSATSRALLLPHVLQHAQYGKVVLPLSGQMLTWVWVSLRRGEVGEGQGAHPVCVPCQAANLVEVSSRSSQQQPDGAVHPAKRQKQPTYPVKKQPEDYKPARHVFDIMVRLQ